MCEVKVEIILYFYIIITNKKNTYCIYIIILPNNKYVQTINSILEPIA